MLSKLSLTLYRAVASDVPALYDLEIASFPPDEAATEEGMGMRQREAGDFFLCAKSDDTGEIVGFVNGTLTREAVLDHDTMSSHYADGRYLVIHSVTVAPAHRRKGVATAMLHDYMMYIVSHCPRVREAFLLAKSYLLGFYTRGGFVLVGESPVVHGADMWYELRYNASKARNAQLQVDAFSAGPFTGNPAAVVFRHGDSKWMQSLAQENNLAETCFVSARYPSPDNMKSFDIRWFTPTTEIDLCGHATLAAAHALYETNRVGPAATIAFHTKEKGILYVQQKVDRDSHLLHMDFPADVPVPCTLSEDEYTLLKAAIHMGAIGGHTIEPASIIKVARSSCDLVVEVTRQAFAALGACPPNIPSIRALGGRGVVFTCAGARRVKAQCAIDSDAADSSHCVAICRALNDPKFDFVSRCFFPSIGIDEDPVTGSAHCALAPFWGAADKFNTSEELTGYQASARGGVVGVRVEGDRVLLQGACMTTISSTVLADEENVIV